MMRRLKDAIQAVAESHGTVLITGESGAGKEVVARAIHDLSPRRDETYLAVNCAALSASLLESELFGHERGAFTGADQLRKGRFELANRGSLLLDEISEIPPSLQAKLLRVLQESSFERVGSSVTQSVDVRVIATTNRDLVQSVQAREFRQDLYFRLNVLPIAIPPLRERLDDVPLLARHFLARVSTRDGAATRSFSPAAIDVMKRYHWPGNVRELQNICERAHVLSPGGEIEPALIEPWLLSDAAVNGTLNGSSGMDAFPPPTISVVETKRAVTDSPRRLEDVERETIVATLHCFNGHRQKTAEALGIGVRTLGLKLRKWKEMDLVAQDL
jgi:transcriptional regulator with GAF, ATPase, and Fis domain